MRSPSPKVRPASWLCMLSAALALCLALAPAQARADESTDLQDLDAQQTLLPTEDQQVVTTTFGTEHITESGDIVLPLSSDELLAAFGHGDTLSVSFLGQTLDLMLHRSASHVADGTTVLFAPQDQGVTLTIKAGDFATTYGIATKETAPDQTTYWQLAEGVEGPVHVEFSLKEKSSRPPMQDLNHGLKYKNDREDFPQLSDDEFANFRVVSTTGMGENVLYRCSTPVNPRRTRSAYADAALREAGVTVIMNLSDNEEDLLAYEGYDQTYYSTATHVAHRLGLSITSDSFKSGLADGMRLFAQNPGTYAVHCIEGKDRTGFAIALLECLMGASEDEVTADYMITFYNYFGVTPQDEIYNEIVQDNIVSQLKRAFEVESLSDVDLVQEAEEYLLSAGLTTEEITQLKRNLGPTKTYQVSFEANGHGTAPDAQTVAEGSYAVRPADPAVDGFVFGGWYLDAACSVPFDFAVPVTQDVTLYARWTQVPAGGGGAGGGAGGSATAGKAASSVQRSSGTTKAATRTVALPKTADPSCARLASGLSLLGLALMLIGRLSAARTSNR